MLLIFSTTLFLLETRNKEQNCNIAKHKSVFYCFAHEMENWPSYKVINL